MNCKAIKWAAVYVAAALGIAGAAGIAAASRSLAAPRPANPAATRAAASAPINGVYYRRRCYARSYSALRLKHRRYAHYHWVYDTDCRATFPASCPYPYPYFGFVYGWHGIW